jgi:hypothetical protein
VQLLQETTGGGARDIEAACKMSKGALLFEGVSEDRLVFAQAGLSFQSRRGSRFGRELCTQGAAET